MNNDFKSHTHGCVSELPYLTLWAKANLSGFNDGISFFESSGSYATHADSEVSVWQISWAKASSNQAT